MKTWFLKLFHLYGWHETSEEYTLLPGTYHLKAIHCQTCGWNWEDTHESCH